MKRTIDVYCKCNVKKHFVSHCKCILDLKPAQMNNEHLSIEEVLFEDKSEMQNSIYSMPKKANSDWVNNILDSYDKL